MMELKNNFLEDPTNQELFKILEVDYTTSENWMELIEIYEKFLEVNDDNELFGKYNLKKALIYDEMLDEPEKALEELKKVIEEEEFNILHLKYFETLSIVTSKIYPLIDVYKIVAKKVDEENQLMFNHKISTLYIRKDDYINAINYIDETLSIDIDYSESLDLLDFIINKKSDDIDVLVATIPIVEKTENWGALLNIYNLILQKKGTLDKEHHLDILNKKINLFENMLTGEEELLFNTLIEAYKLNQLPEYFEKIEYYAQMLDQYDKFINLLISLYENEELRPFYAYKIGTISFSVLNDTEKALKYLLDYSNIAIEYYEEAFSFLIELLNTQENYQELVNTYLKQVNFVEDAFLKVDIYKQIASIYEYQLFRLDEAVDIYQKVINIEPENIEHYFEVERLYEELKNWPSLIEIIDKLINYVDDIESYEKKKAIIYDEKIVNYSKAIDEYRNILEKYGYASNLEIISRLRELYKLEERFEDLKDFLEIYKDFATSEEEAINIDFEIASIYSEKFDDYETAFEKLKSVLDIAPYHEETIKKLLIFIKDNHLVNEIYDYLDGLLDSENNIEYLIKLNQIKIKTTVDKSEQAELCIKVGDIFTEREGNPEKAFPYLAKGFQLSPSEYTYRKFKEHYEIMSVEDNALPVMENVIEIIEDKNLSNIVNLDIGKLLFRDTETKDKSIKYLENVIANNPEEMNALLMLDEIYSENDNNKELYRILLLKLEIDDDKIETLYRLRDLSLDFFNDKEKALSFITKLYELDEYNKDEHRETIISFMRDLNEYEKLSLFYENILEEQEYPEYIEALADIYVDHLNNLERAGELYEQVVEVTENRSKVLNNLERVYTETKDNDRLTKILEDQLELLKDLGDKKGALETIFKLGKLYVEYSAQYEKGSKMFSFLLKAKYQPEVVIQYLEVYIDNQEVLFFVSNTLKGYYVYQEEWYNLITLYKKELDFKDEDEKIEILEKIAEIYYENLKNTSESIKFYNELFKTTIDYTYLQKIEEILESENNYSKLAEIYENYIAELSFDNLEDKESLYLKLSNIYRNNLEKPSTAIKFLLNAFNENPSIIIADNIIELYKESDNNEKVKEFYYKKLEILEDVEEQTALKIELSRFLIEKFHEFEEGINLLIEILEWENSNLRVVSMLLKLNNYLKLENYELKLKLLSVLKPILTDNMEYENVVSIFESLINLDDLEYDKKIELMQEEVDFLFDVAEYDTGFKKYESLIFESKGNNDILNKSIEYAELANNFDAIITIYKTFLSRVKTLDLEPEEIKSKALDFYYRLGEVSFKYLGEFEQAEKYFTAILDKNPNHLNSLYKLEELYQEQGEYEKLRDLYTKLLSFSIEDKQKINVYKKLAKLLEESLYEEENAIKFYEKIIELDQTDEEVLDSLFNYYKKEKNLKSILTIVDAQYVLHKDDSFYLNRGSYYYLKNYKKTDNIEYLNKSIKLAEESYNLDKNNDKTELILIEAYRDSGDHEKIVNIYTEKLPSIMDVDKKVDINIELAKIYASKMNDIAKAEECVNFVKEIDPYDTRTLDVKEQILEAQGKWEELLDLLEEKMNIVEGEKLNEVIFNKLKLLTEKFSRYEEAEEYLRDLIGREPDNRDYLFYGEEIFLKKDNMKDYFDFIKKQLPETESLEFKSDIMSKMGDIAYKHFKKEDLAVKCYNKALEFSSTSLLPISGLKKIALDKKDYTMYSTLLKQMLDKAKGEEYNNIKEELIDIYINKLNKPELVIPFKEVEYNEHEDDALMLELLGLYSLSKDRFNFDDYFDIFFEKLKTDKNIEDRHDHLLNLGKASHNFGDFENAKSCFELANRLKMGYIPGQIALGKLLVEMGDTKGALKSFQLLQLNQNKIDDIELKKELFLNLGRLRAGDNDALRAKSMYKKLLELDPDNQEAMDYLGM
jgi:tetratricopeptide (TPR) repeat protein